MLIIVDIYMSSNVYYYYYYTKGERNDVDEQACKRLTAKVSIKCCTQTSASLRLHNSFLLKYNNNNNNNKYLRTCINTHDNTPWGL